MDVYILLVEDDPEAAKLISTLLTQRFPGLGVELLRSEADFRVKLGSPERPGTLAIKPPRAVLLDMMIRWATPAEGMVPPPDEVRRDGPWRAGFRCYRLLRDRKLMMPVILLTVLDLADIQGELNEINDPNRPVYISKPGRPEPLIEEMTKLGFKGLK